MLKRHESRYIVANATALPQCRTAATRPEIIRGWKSQECTRMLSVQETRIIVTEQRECKLF